MPGATAARVSPAPVEVVAAGVVAAMTVRTPMAPAVAAAVRAERRPGLLAAAAAVVAAPSPSTSSHLRPHLRTTRCNSETVAMAAPVVPADAASPAALEAAVASALAP